MEMFYRVSFFIVYGSFFFIREYFASKVRCTNPEVNSQKSLEEAMENEGKLSVSFRTMLSFGLILSLLVYLANPKSLARLNLNLPYFVRRAGLLGALSSLPLLYLIHRELGKNWSPDLVIQKDHQLVTTGVYQWVRHPMYSVLSIFMICISLLSANVIIIFPHFLTLLTLFSRIENEEKMMIERFGEEYVKYTERAGLLVPKWSTLLLKE